MSITPQTLPDYTLPAGKALMVRTVTPDGGSYDGFRWPLNVGAVVEAPDWNDRRECGGGLHGLRWAVGDPYLVDMSTERPWLVCEFDDAAAVDIGGKIKTPRCRIVHVGDQRSAITLVQRHAPAGTRCNWGTATAGYRGTATAGNGGTATAGDGGTATAGDGGTATAGDGGGIAIARWNGKGWKFCVAEVGEDGLKPNVAYRLNDAGVFVEATP